MTTAHRRIAGRPIAGALLAVALAAASVEAYREAAAGRVVTLADQSGARRVLAPGLDDAEAACRPACPVRARLAAAAARLSIAAGLPASAARAADLAAAETDIGEAQAVEPLNGEAASERAYLAALRAQDGEALRLLAKSYQVQPFQRGIGYWRVAYGAAHWDQGSVGLRRSLLDEAEWLWVTDAARRPAIAGAFASEAAQLALSLRVEDQTGPPASGAP